MVKSSKPVANNLRWSALNEYYPNKIRVLATPALKASFKKFAAIFLLYIKVMLSDTTRI